MVLLTMTESIVDGLNKLAEPRTLATGDDEQASASALAPEPSIIDPVVDKPISHSQIVRLWKILGASNPSTAYSLEQLLQGSQVFSPPPPPKPEPSEEYKALMTRLRREEDERSYERMINPPLGPRETSGNRFSDATHAFAQVHRPSNSADMGDDDVAVNEVHRQVMLIINFLVSIAGVAATLWIAGRWWSLPSRLFLTMGGSVVVAIAEVTVYSGYMWRLDQAKQKQSTVREVKQVVKTWVVGQDDADSGIEHEKTVISTTVKSEVDEETVRKRHVTTSQDVNS